VWSAISSGEHGKVPCSLRNSGRTSTCLSRPLHPCHRPHRGQPPPRARKLALCRQGSAKLVLDWQVLNPLSLGSMTQGAWRAGTLHLRHHCRACKIYCNSPRGIPDVASLGDVASVIGRPRRAAYHRRRAASSGLDRGREGRVVGKKIPVLY
jgi:hypothetical protein